MATNAVSPEYMTATDVADFTGYTVQTINKYKNLGLLKVYYPYGKRTPLFIKDEVINAFLLRGARSGVH